MRRLFFLLQIALVVLLLNSCGEDRNPLQIESEAVEFLNPIEQRVTRDGGTVVYPDGAMVQIPQNALSSDSTIRITKTQDNFAYPSRENSQLITAIYELKSDYQSEYFEDAVVISLPVAYKNITDQDIAFLAYWDGDRWTRIASYFDKESASLVGLTNHFSVYGGLIQRAELKPNEFLEIPYYYQAQYNYCAYTCAAQVGF